MTFSYANNYGAMLQCYALKTMLNLLGAHVSVINYKPRQRNLTLKEFIKKTIFIQWLLYTNRQFEGFRKSYITDNVPFIKKEQLPELNNKFDYFLSGSDQVWNFHGNGFDTAKLIEQGYLK